MNRTLLSFLVLLGVACSSPVGKVRFEDGSYQVQTPTLKMEFSLGSKNQKFSHEPSPNSIHNAQTSTFGNHFFAANDPYKNFVPPRPVVDDGYRVDLDPMVGTEGDAHRVIGSTLYFDTVDHEKIVLNYAERRHDGNLSEMRLHSIRPFFPFSTFHPRGGQVHFRVRQ